MNNNVVDFRVMRTLCDRLWNLQAKLTLREPHSWDPRQRTTWSRVVTSDYNSVLLSFSPTHSITMELWYLPQYDFSTHAMVTPSHKATQGNLFFCFCFLYILYKLLFSRISRARPSRKFPLQLMSIYSNDNIRTIAKLTTRELPQKSKNAKITVRENNGLYSISCNCKQ